MASTHPHPAPPAEGDSARHPPRPRPRPPSRRRLEALALAAADRAADDLVTAAGDFDLEAFRRLRFGGGRFCPHCDGRAVQGWGWSGTRRRYRCTGCRRTFNDLTGTPLAYLKHLDRWPGFCHAVRASWTVRRTARALTLAVSTAFRWRHRILVALRQAEARRLTGTVAVAETCFPHSEKGRRDLERSPRRRGELFGTWLGPRVWVLLARERPGGRAFSDLVGPRRPGPHELERCLAPRLEPDVTLQATLNLPAVPAFAARSGLASTTLRGTAALHHPAALYNTLLRRWLQPFQGVATRYLPNYLAWHRFLHDCDRTGLNDSAAHQCLLACAFP
jgi:transposase-like protein